MKAVKSEPTADPYSVALAAALDSSRLPNTEVADRIDVSPNVISHWKSGYRPMPPRYAPKVAALLGVRPESISAGYARLRAEGCLPAYTDDDSGLPPGHVPIDRLHGFCRENAPNYVVLPAFVVEMKIGKTSLEHVRWVLQPTSAMAPTIPQGSLVLIDSTRNSHEDVVDGDLYAYELYGRPYVRRILVGRDSWSLCGHDASTERVVIRITDLEDLKIQGTVLGWL